MKWEVPEGATVRVSHLRRVEGSDKLMTAYEYTKAGLTPLPHGGRTEVAVELGDTGALGVAECSLLDNYNRAIGRAIATGRALRQFHEGGDSDWPALRAELLSNGATREALEAKASS